MRVVVNCLSASGKRTGVGHHTAELFAALRRAAAGDAIDAFPSPWVGTARNVWLGVRPWLEPRHAAPAPAAAPARPGLKARLFHSIRTQGQALVAANFRAFVRAGRHDLYHEPNFIPFACDRPVVATIHDLSALRHPEWHPADRVAHFEKHFLAGLGRVTHFLTVSEFCRREVIDTLGVAPERVSRTYNGMRHGLRPLPADHVRAELKRLGLPPAYLLYLGTIEPRKNVRTLLEAYCALDAALRDRYPLLLVGGWGWNAGDVAAYLDAHAAARGVRRLGYVAEADLPVLLNGARALAYPSVYEGFGLPPVEMMACGGAVLASTAGAVAETVGPCGHLIDPHDVGGWRDALRRALTDDDWWRSLRAGAVEQAGRFTWENCARDTLAVYRRVVRPAAPARRAG